MWRLLTAGLVTGLALRVAYQEQLIGALREEIRFLQPPSLDGEEA